MNGSDVTSGNAPQARVDVDGGLSGRAVGRPAEIAPAGATGAAGGPAGHDIAQGFGQDQAVLSGAAGLAAQSNDAGVREAKVAALQQAIATGTYSVPSSAVADKLIGHLLH